MNRLKLNQRMMKLFISISLFGLIVSVNSCKKAELNKDTSSAQDNAYAQSAWDDVTKQCETAAETAEDSMYINLTSCPTITLDNDPGVFPVTITVDFGTEDCTGTDGRRRRGKLIFSSTGRYREAGTQFTITPSDYYVNDYKVEGSRVVENLGEGSDSILRFKATTDGTITTPEGEVIAWNSEITRSWTEGRETGFFTKDSADKFMGLAGILDDVYELTGTAEGTDRDGQAYTMIITEPLVIRLDCRWITQGIFELQPENIALRTFNYGDGVCDNQALLTIRNKEYIITLRN